MEEAAGRDERRDPTLASAPPQANEGEAEHVALAAFGMVGRARRLTSERDLNFAITSPDGTARVLKYANAGDTAEILDFQLAALEHVAAVAPAIPVPRVVRTNGGSRLTQAPDASGQPHHVFMLGYLAGRPFSALDTGAAAPPDAAAQAGAMLARLGGALRDFDHPAAGRALLWDVSRAAALRPRLGHVADPALRALVTGVLDRFEAVAVPALAGLRRQVVHNDLNPHNIIVAEAPGRHITGIIDFGDMVRTPLINDLATAASYHVAQGVGPLGNALAMIGAYNAVRPLDDAERALLPLLMATRNTMTIAITAWRAARYPENRPYILRNVPAATAALRKLTDLGADVAADLIRQTCQEPAP